MPIYGSDYANTSCARVWLTWNADTTNCTSATTAWVVWNGDYTTSNGTVDTWGGTEAPAWETPKAATPEAQQKAEAILVESLDAQQRDEFTKDRCFTVESAKSKRRYRIKKGRVANIEELDAGGRVVARFCVHPAKYVPDYDTMLAQKLHLEHDDEALLKIANRHGIRAA